MHIVILWDFLKLKYSYLKELAVRRCYVKVMISDNRIKRRDWPCCMPAPLTSHYINSRRVCMEDIKKLEREELWGSYKYMSNRHRDPLVVGRVIGEVLDPFTRSISLRVSYNSREVNNGCELRPSQVVSQPRVDIGGDDLRTFYTLVSYANPTYCTHGASFSFSFSFSFFFNEN